MMNNAFLKSVPQYYVCPFCGSLHKWNGKHLGYYNNTLCEKKLKCDEEPYRGDVYFIQFDYCNNLHYRMKSLCRKIDKVEGMIPISSIQWKPDTPMVYFNIEVTTEGFVGLYDCKECGFSISCNYARGERRKKTEIQLGFVFDESEYRIVQ